VLVFESSKVTTTCFLSYSTSICETPGTLWSAFYTVIGHASQVIPETFRVTVLGDAQAVAVRATIEANAAIRALKFFIAFLLLADDLVQKLQHVWKNQCNQDERGNRYKENLVDATCSRSCTKFPRVTNLRRSKDLPSRKEQID